MKAIKEISNKDIGSTLDITATIQQVIQTGGPTLFVVQDHSGSIKIKGFDGPGKRAYPEIDQDDAIQASIKVKQFDGKIEGEIQSVKKLSDQEKLALQDKIAQQMHDDAKPDSRDFLVQSPILEKLKERIHNAATIMRKSLLNQQPILIRHHNDTDGYSSGYAIEYALRKFLREQGVDAKTEYQMVTRAPCMAPFYEIEDSIKDSVRALMAERRFGEKKPLIVIVDNGSSHEDLFGVQHAKIMGMEFLVIDHHVIGETDVISPLALEHVTPYLVDEEGSRISAGQLCVEVAQWITPCPEIAYIAAMAGQADRIENKELMDQYFALAQKAGKDAEYLRQFSGVLDFMSSKFRFMEAKDLVDEMMNPSSKTQSKLIELYAPRIQAMYDKGLTIGLTQVKKEMVQDVLLQMLDVENTFSRGMYPKPGNLTGVVHDAAKEEKDAVVTIGYLSDVLIIRATEHAPFSVHELLDYIKEHIPNAFADGGGHTHAGSLKFVPALQHLVLQAVKDYLTRKQS